MSLKFNYKKILIWVVLLIAVNQIARYLGSQQGAKLGKEESDRRFKETFYKSYVEDCVRRGSTDKYCKCYGGELITRNSVEQIQKDTKMLKELGFTESTTDDVSVEKATKLIENNPDFLDYAIRLKEIEQFCKSQNTK